jgi:hypothetical protein
MAIAASGAISLGTSAGTDRSISAEFGGTTPHALSEYYGDGNAPASSGAISFSDFHGTSAALTLKTYGKVIDVNNNSTSYSGSLSATVAAGDVIVIAKVTGFGDYARGSTTIQSISSTVISHNQAWYNPIYGHTTFEKVTATASASSISVSCSEGSSNRQGMYVFAWLIGGGATHDDTATSASTGTLTVDTGEDGAIVVGSAYTDDAYAIPNLNNTDFETTFNRDMHVWAGHAVQSGTAATYSMTVSTTGTNNRIWSFIKA